MCDHNGNSKNNRLHGRVTNWLSRHKNDPESPSNFMKGGGW